MLRIALFLSFLHVSVVSFGDNISMAFGDAIPPFSFPDTDSGIELDVIGEALAYKQHTLKPVYNPLARVPVAFRLREVDAAMTGLGKTFDDPVYYGDPAVVYNNVMITLKSRNLVIEKPSDLEGLWVISFQGALKRYPEWLEPVLKTGKYLEQNNQLLQVRTLNQEHYDVVLSDINIFKYFALQVKKQQGKDIKPVQYHSFIDINPLDYRPVFWDKKVRDDFNEGLTHLKQSGRYQAIYDYYLND